MTDQILVDRARCGGWVFERLTVDQLAVGQRVQVADLTGLGARRGEFHPGCA